MELRGNSGLKERLTLNGWTGYKEYTMSRRIRYDEVGCVDKCSECLNTDRTNTAAFTREM